jgi:hypothetical protein
MQATLAKQERERRLDKLAALPAYQCRQNERRQTQATAARVQGPVIERRKGFDRRPRT